MKANNLSRPSSLRARHTPRPQVRPGLRLHAAAPHPSGLSATRTSLPSGRPYGRAACRHLGTVMYVPRAPAVTSPLGHKARNAVAFLGCAACTGLLRARTTRRHADA